MAIEREAKATWTGDLRGGQGEFDLESSHAVEHEQVTFASPFEQPGGKTSPEELIAAAHATCFSMALSGGLARAPKSNASYVAIKEATQDVREHGHLRPPDELRDASYYGAKKLGRGQGYIYPHSDPAGFEVDYLPEELRGRSYYRPSGTGEEEAEDGD